MRAVRDELRVADLGAHGAGRFSPAISRGALPVASEPAGRSVASEGVGVGLEEVAPFSKRWPRSGAARKSAG